MHNYFVYDRNIVDEQACVNDAEYLFRKRETKSKIHIEHRRGESCNWRCYIVPRVGADNDALRK